MVFKIDKIIRVTDAQVAFRSRAYGWAPLTAAGLLSKARLDWQSALARTLRDYATLPRNDEEDARLILGYVTLRALAEGTLKLFFTVWYSDYAVDVDAIVKSGKFINPDEVKFDSLIRLFEKKADPRWTPLLRLIQSRGNAIHAFRSRPIGTFAELQDAIHQYGEFLVDTDQRLPYPDNELAPSRA